MKRIKHFKVLSIAVAFILVFSVVFPLSTRAENASTDKFTAEQSINGTKVTVSSDPEVFPEGTTMEVKEVNLTSTEDSLVASQQQADQKSIKKVALDITMKNKEGQEIEPDTSKGKVHVSFTNDDIKDHTTNVYHIDDNLKVESLKLTKSDDTVTGETTGFSVYVMNFIVGNTTIHYGAQLGEEFNLSKVLSKLLNVDASNIKNVTSNNKNDFNKYGRLTNKDDGFYLTITKQFPARGNGLYFNVTYTNADKEVATATLNITSYSQPTFSSDASWLNNYTLSKEDENHTITLYQYKGTDKDLNIPATVKIDDIDYQIVMSGAVYSETSIKSIVFNKDNNGNRVKATESLARLFGTCTSLEDVDFSGLDTANVTNMSSMFSYCTKLTKVDISVLDTRNVTNMSSMFSMCSAMVNDGVDSYIRFKTENGPNYFTTSNVQNMNGMFFRMNNLIKLDVSSFDTTNLVEMDQFAASNGKLEEIDLSSFKGAVSTNAAIANADQVYAPLSYSSNIKKITLGENWHAKDGKNYLGLGIEGNWQNTTSKAVVTNLQLSDEFDPSMAGTYERTTLPPSYGSKPQYIADGYKIRNNMWEVHTPEEKFRAYCINKHLAAPYGYYDKVYINPNATEATKTIDENGHSNYIYDYISPNNSGYSELNAPNLVKGLITLIKNEDFNGENGYDQDDIWHFTDEYSNDVPSSVQKYIDEGKTYKKEYDSYNLYIYVPSASNLANKKKPMQNLLSIEGANSKTYAGLTIQKVDNTTEKNPVGGATFRIYQTDENHNETGGIITNNKTYLEFITSSNGVGGIYRMDATEGLPVGHYVLKEEAPPAGYDKNTTPYYFDVTDNDNQILKRIVDKNNKEIQIVNNVHEDYKGGGIKLQKVDASTNKGLMGAKFTLYKKSDPNKPLNTYTTDANGYLTTGNKDLEITTPSTTYILRETQAPSGYKITAQDIEITLTDSDENTFKDLGTVTNTAKTGSITLKAKKELKNSGTLSNGQFTFQLLDSNGKVLQTKTNEANGDINFDPINFTAADMPGKDYVIKEEKGSDTNIEYDSHEANVRVLVYEKDDGTFTVETTTDEDGYAAKFVNTAKIDFGGQLSVKKIVKDGFGETVKSNASDKFKFYLYLTSESADLNTRTFNYEINDDSGNKVKGTYALNPPENKNDKYKYRSQTPIELSSKQTLELTGLPVGASYEVIEDDYSSNGYSTSVVANTNIKETDNTNNYQPTIDNASRKVSGEVSSDGDSITYTNSQQRIIPTSADSMTRMSFWILGTAGALVLVLILKRRLKVSKK
ncbi:BspA family leucine-rich repeat surface protein [Sharpea azabuensis]|uniref:BspA family leucine-rich repeat surface protein n=1 Tax=Sharpea porci TaxID=2652286 RepID=A0A844FW43_9FIRM|nr:SpaA isopeptide-forming pilin-related protein [Sharpea porci]MST90187.1 BspA family leucine-rich repeat surface protein [Sharpea porci]